MSEDTSGELLEPTEGDENAPANPKPSVDDLSELAHRVLTGDIVLPKFQRDFVWPPAKVLGLLDSIAHNYPIGSILLWRSKLRLKSEREIADLKIADRDLDYPVNYLLDGQQRLSTICGSYYWRPSDQKQAASIWNIVYDFPSESFQHVEIIDPGLSQMPVRLLSDPAAYFRRVAAVQDDEHVRRAEQLFNRFSRYKVAGVLLGDLPIEAIGTIFERINSTGIPLTVVDLMRAATWTPDFDLVDRIDDLLDRLDEHDLATCLRSAPLIEVSCSNGSVWTSYSERPSPSLP